MFKRDIIVLCKCIREDKEKELQLNKWYVMDSISIGQSNSSVILKDVKGIYNSICFDFYIIEDDVLTPFNIYQSEFSAYYFPERDK